MGTSGLTEIGAALEEICQNHISFAETFPLATALDNQKFRTLDWKNIPQILQGT
jgi:hypothetical protein